MTVMALAITLAACVPDQSALVPRGEEAQKVATLFWGMTIFLGFVMVGVVVAAALAISGHARTRAVLADQRFILGAGLVFPTVSLLALLAWGLVIMASRGGADEDPRALRITVIGEMWWWRVIYELPDGTRLESANELRIPVGVPVRLALESADVIHSFWVPSLAGKLDMIPGRTNVLTLKATEPGVSRGQCAEYCGGAHALMSFHVVALEPAEFETWLAAERAPAAAATGEGARLFAEAGCGACHRVRGEARANGVVGPDLTHVGSRLSLGAATLPNDAAAFTRWIRDSQAIKPENRMPPYGILSETDLVTLANYLEGLK
jgi:cytochrome c oxidase subunit 2